jgi:protease I
MTKVAVLVHNYFEQAEFTGPIEALKEKGVEVEVLGAAQKDLTAMQHDTQKGESFTADKLLEEVDSNDYDALILPGGVVNADKLRMDEKARQIVHDFVETGKPIAAICHAPWLLVSARVVRGLHLTSYTSLQDDIMNAGGEWEDSPVVVDGQFITSRKPDDIPQFNEAICKALGV